MASGRSRPARVPAGPLVIASSDLSQGGQQLVWRVRTTSAFSPGALAHQKRSLCLLIERLVTGVVAGQACVGARAGKPQIFYRRLTRQGWSKSRRLNASIDHSGAKSLAVTFLPSQVGLTYRSLRWQAASQFTGAGCQTGAGSASSCEQLLPARPKLLKLHTPQLVGCRAGTASKVFHGQASEREIALTFDDGPWPTPPAGKFIDLLARYHVPGTFFEIGQQIPEYDASGVLERSMLAHGDMIGDHTWTHPDMTHLSPAAQLSQLQRTDKAIRQRTGFTPCLWRPPYGAVDSQVVSTARSLGLVTVMWDVDPQDWRLPGTQSIYTRVVSAAHNGAIVLQHFGGGPRYQTLAALAKEIHTLRAKGYRFVTVAQLLGLKLIYR